MSLMKTLYKHRDDILRIAEQHGAYNVRVFGSVARGEDKEGSDIDLLIEMEKGRSLFDLIRFKHDLEDLLCVKVDVLTDKSLHWFIKDQVLKEAKAL